MKKSIVFFTILCIITSGVIAQIFHDHIKAKTYLQDGETASGAFGKDHVISLLDKPLLSIDEKGKKRQPVSFYITFKERNIYYTEDYKPFIGTDSYTFPSDDSRVGDELIDVLKERLKVGDTLKFESILNYNSIKNQDSAFYSEPIIIYIK